MSIRPKYSDELTFDYAGSPRTGPQGQVIDPEYAAKIRSVSKKSRVHVFPSEWVSHAIRIKDQDRGVVKPITFEERRYLPRIYDTSARKVLMMTSRQTEKSTTLGNKLLATSTIKTLHSSLFVTPSAMQTSVFSKTRLAGIIDISPLLKAMTHKALTNNLLEREFLTRSVIYLRYAFLSADRIRGLSVNDVYVDEIQDIHQDNMPVIEETASHHKRPFYMYSGTPKSFDNTIESYWAQSSTQSEWAIPCEHCGTPKTPSSWHWNVLGEKNLGKRGPVCERCSNLINPEHPMARWVEMNPGAEYEGYRICRLMVPWYFKDQVQWDSILKAWERYPRAQFMNEVMAISFDAGTKPLLRSELIMACDENFSTMSEDYVEKLSRSHAMYMGLDWGPGEAASFSLMVVGCYCRGDDGFQIVYMRRFDGPMTDPEKQLNEIRRLIMKFRIHYVGADYGMGFYQNKALTSQFGPGRIHMFQYSARAPSKVMYSGKLHRYIVFRSPVMADVFTAIKRLKIRFPAWDLTAKPYGDDILSIFSEYSDTLKMIKYGKPRSIPDDTFHSVVFCLLASMLDHRRPDIMAPIHEEEAEEEYDLMEQFDPDVGAFLDD